MNLQPQNSHQTSLNQISRRALILHPGLPHRGTPRIQRDTIINHKAMVLDPQHVTCHLQIRYGHWTNIGSTPILYACRCGRVLSRTGIGSKSGSKVRIGIEVEGGSRTEVQNRIQGGKKIKIDIVQCKIRSNAFCTRAGEAAAEG
ncbi:hypothetical protein EVAR_40175_1 [Eumeta japonica]|uniref:Uncharacterized protein n=1 Tax=Eumeta variegata TaxID=151549 RepID=A0A4C1XN04_EUMVA|nr:hypothetical protein EVAR_40175_1 [Eumeta japonica]